MSRKKNKNELPKPNVDMWEIEGNEEVKEYAEEIADIVFLLTSLEKELKDMNDSVEVTNNRINIYLGNIFGIQNFEQNKHAIIIREKYLIDVYNVEDIPNDIDDVDVSIDSLPEPVLKHQSNVKQTKKILEQLNNYNDLVDDFNILLDEYTGYLESHSTVWDEAKQVINNLYLLALEDDSEQDTEFYDEEKHALLIAENEDNEWGFRYIRKEDESKFNNFLSEKLEEFEIEE